MKPVDLARARILVTNDDGIHAPGLEALIEIASQLSSDVWVVAPEVNQSGAGHSLSLSRPIRAREVSEGKVAVDGTPTDCVLFAVKHLMKDRKPDLVLSGVNAGANMADDVTYSGTVSAAIEGALAGIRSIALSQVYASEGMGDAVPFDAARAWGAKVIAPLLDAPLPKRTLVNVNFPALAAEKVNGIRVVRQGFHDYSRGSVVEGRDPRGYPYYWFGLEAIEHTLDHGTDLEAIDEGFVSVTPLQLDLTHHSSLGASSIKVIN